MADKNPRGFFDKVLVVDCETSGLFYTSDNPAVDQSTGKEYQTVSWGLIVADAATCTAIDELYVEIKWNGKSLWDSGAEVVHGLSKTYLEQHGMSEEDAAVEIASLILKHWGPNSTVCLAGHNVATFDLIFLRRLLTKFGINVKFGNRHICTNTIGAILWGTYNSDDLFNAVGVGQRDKHNAMDDAKAVLRTLQVTKTFWNAFVVPNIG